DRGGSGVTAHNLTEKTGALTAVRCVSPENDDILLITSEGVIIRTGCEAIRVCGRASQGVILMRLDEGIKVISVAHTEKEEDEADETDETAPAEAPSEDGQTAQTDEQGGETAPDAQ
ncbi:MAG: DNA gyrase subunit A, partial [Clostridia bacterium]|nr:DNA gyrase subunit A [Clostridia bacterium]